MKPGKGVTYNIALNVKKDSEQIGITVKLSGSNKMTYPINEMQSTLSEVAHYARVGDYSDAASQLNIGLQKVQAFLHSGNLPDEYIRKMFYSLETMFMMQKQDDWVALADVIEFEFIPLLQNVRVPRTISAT